MNKNLFEQAVAAIGPGEYPRGIKDRLYGNEPEGWCVLRHSPSGEWRMNGSIDRFKWGVLVTVNETLDYIASLEKELQH